MKPNTSNKEQEKVILTLTELNRVTELAEKQGYAKALDDAEKIIDNKVSFIDKKGNSRRAMDIYADIIKEIARLAKEKTK